MNNNFSLCCFQLENNAYNMITMMVNIALTATPQTKEGETEGGLLVLILALAYHHRNRRN